MFLNYIKKFFLKNTLKNKWQELSNPAVTNTIQTLGLIVDESVFSETEALIQGLIAKGFSQSKITIIVYRDKLNKKELDARFTFSPKAVNWIGTIKDSVVIDFVQTDFDLLISYYEIEKAELLLITNKSKAHFKVGFSSIDSRFNQLMIDTKLQNHSVFVNELYKYLRILNKIES